MSIFKCSSDILELHDLFPNIDISILAGKYWDNNNDLQKTVDQILRSQASVFCCFSSL